MSDEAKEIIRESTDEELLDAMVEVFDEVEFDLQTFTLGYKLALDEHTNIDTDENFDAMVDEVKQNYIAITRARVQTGRLKDLIGEGEE